MIEEWRDIFGFEGLYQVSSLGRVKSLGNKKSRKEKILKPGKGKNGYLGVVLCKNGKVTRLMVHRLVANTFIPNPQNRSQVNHCDENKLNNNVCNLEWCDPKYNINYGTARERMTKNMTGPYKSKPVLCVETGIIFPSLKDAHRQTGVHYQHIIACCKGKCKTAKGYHWRYVD